MASSSAVSKRKWAFDLNQDTKVSQYTRQSTRTENKDELKLKVLLINIIYYGSSLQ